MRYRVKKETKPRLQTFEKYKAVAVHYQTIESNQLLKETAQRTGFSEGTQALYDGSPSKKTKRPSRINEWH